MTPRIETPEEARARLDAEVLTAGESARLWQRLQSSTVEEHRPRRALILGFALAATALAAVLLVIVRGKEGRPANETPIASACDVDPSHTEFRLGKECGERDVQVAGDDWRLQAGTEVARIENGARVIDGQIRFRVRPRTASQFRVQVSHGEVRVIGTVFTVEQRAARGFVAVVEGVIEFVWTDGTRERVSSGQTLRWPRQPKPQEPPPSTSAPDESEQSAKAEAGKTDAGKSSAPAADDMDQTMERLLQLRSQRRYAEAAALLEKTMGSGGLSPAQQERLSYELGLAMEAGGKPSCGHWKKHVKRFGSSRHADAMARRLERCGAE